MLSRTRRRGLGRLTVASLAVLAAPPALANVALTLLSTDPFTNANSQHRTEVEPDGFRFGNTIVTAIQTGRIFDGGSADISFATRSSASFTHSRDWRLTVTGAATATASAWPSSMPSRKLTTPPSPPTHVQKAACPSPCSSRTGSPSLDRDSCRP
ncbi:hypothetical protein J5X84_39715 [Streptosporangiaceae bacterium NEAU-GS5]|nr:hypothetical protein [Streptosporangiaceae bacterium NEAU-GS5]